MEPVAIKIEYWTLPDGSPDGDELNGIEEFRGDLQNAYVALVRGQSGDCGGGLYEFVVSVATSITFRDVANLILGGVAYDVIKSGAHSFVLRPLIEAFEKLKLKNSEKNVDIGELRFSFQDVDIVITKVCSRPLFEELGGIFKALAESFERIKVHGESPYVIHIPIFEDPDSRICRFRSLLDVDETIEGVNSNDYLRIWGVRYKPSCQIRVFDVARRLLIDASYMTQDEYWNAWDEQA